MLTASSPLSPFLGVLADWAWLSPQYPSTAGGWGTAHPHSQISPGEEAGSAQSHGKQIYRKGRTSGALPSGDHQLSNPSGYHHNKSTVHGLLDPQNKTQPQPNPRQAPVSCLATGKKSSVFLLCPSCWNWRAGSEQSWEKPLLVLCPPCPRSERERDNPEQSARFPGSDRTHPVLFVLHPPCSSPRIFWKTRALNNTDLVSELQPNRRSGVCVLCCWSFAESLLVCLKGGHLHFLIPSASLPGRCLWEQIVEGEGKTYATSSEPIQLSASDLWDKSPIILLSLQASIKQTAFLLIKKETEQKNSYTQENTEITSSSQYQATHNLIMPNKHNREISLL